MSRKKLFLNLCLVVLWLLLSSSIVLADDLAKLDAGGMKILIIVRRIGFWVILTKGIFDLIKAGISGDYKSVSKIVLGCLMLYGALFLLPWGLRMIEDIF